MNVIVVEYNANWPILFEGEAKRIKQILGRECIEVHHIGSTAVKHLKSKPIIDIMVVVNSISVVDTYNTKFEILGYECMGEFGIAGRRYFRKGGDNRTHQVHIFEQNNQNDIQRHLAVRNYLRTHHDIAHEYGELKEKLALQFPNNIEAYCEGKDAFVKHLEQKSIEYLDNTHLNRINLITLGVKDIKKSISFYRDGLGFECSVDEENPEIVFFNTNGSKLALYPLDGLIKDIGDSSIPDKRGFPGITLAYNCKSKDEVDGIFAKIKEIGGVIVKPPQNGFWGGYSGYFTDPEGYYWEVAYADFWKFDDNNMLIL